MKTKAFDQNIGVVAGLVVRNNGKLNRLKKTFPKWYLIFALLIFLATSPTISAGISLPKNQYDIVVALGFNHVPISIPYNLIPDDFDDSTMTVTSDVTWAIPTVNSAENTVVVNFDTADLIVTYTATLTINDGTSSTELFIGVNISPLNKYSLKSILTFS